MSVYAHADLVSQVSKPLAAMMNLDMAEKGQGFAELDELDQGTFVRFLEWLYRGYYHAATPTQLTPPDQIQSSTESKSGEYSEEDRGQIDSAIPQLDEGPLYDDVPADEEYTWTGKTKGKKFKRSGYSEGNTNQRSMTQRAKESFVQRKYTVRQTFLNLPQPQPNQSEYEDYTEVFLCHAYLHVFADKYGIQSLKVLALEELHATLAAFTLHQQRTSDIVTLLHYVYSKAPRQSNEKEDLRTLVMQYVECEIDTFLKDDDLRDHLLGNEGAILGDFLKVVKKRLAQSNTALQYGS